LKAQGGLGVIDLVIENKAHLFKHLHKFFHKTDVPQVDLTWKAHYTAALAPQARSPRGSFWWRALCRLFDQYRAISKGVVLTGDTTMFWRDIWNFGSLQLYPHLFSFVEEPNCSVQRFLNLWPIMTYFQLPLCIEASHQLAELSDSLAE
jgi:hypothetical protein